MSDDPLLRVSDAAQLLSIGVKKLRELGLPSEGVRPKRYRQSVLQAWSAASGTARDRRAKAASDAHTKYPRWTDSSGTSRAASTHPLFNRWRNIRRRTTDPDDYDYSGRGVSMYEPWRENPAAFYDWIECNLPDLGPNDSLDRINNDGDYEPGNLRAADAFVQNNNRRNCRGYESRELSTRLECICQPSCPGDTFCPEVAMQRELPVPGVVRQVLADARNREPLVMAWPEVPDCLCPPGCDGGDLTCPEASKWLQLSQAWPRPLDMPHGEETAGCFWPEDVDFAGFLLD